MGGMVATNFEIKDKKWQITSFSVSFLICGLSLIAIFKEFNKHTKGLYKERKEGEPFISTEHKINKVVYHSVDNDEFKEIDLNEEEGVLHRHLNLFL